MENRIKIALVGYGSMGKEIERLANKNIYTITHIFDENKQLNPSDNFDFDVAIDFTHPAVVMDNIKILAKMGKNIVVGTTGWLNHFDEVKEIAETNKIGLVYGSNYSVGMQMFMMIADYASKLVNKFESYDVFMHELHHKNKMDAPSGTALSLANILLQNLDRKSEILEETSNRKINPEELHVTSTRGGEIAGTHTIYFDSIADTIEMTHRARNRSGFAEGALYAAKLVHNKVGFFDFTEMMKNL